MQMVSLFSDVFKCSFTTKCQSLAKFKAMRMFSLCFAKRKHFNEHWQSNSSKTHHAQKLKKTCPICFGVISPKRWPVQISGCSAQCWSHFGNPQSPLNRSTDYGLRWSRSPWINQMFVFVKLPIERENFWFKHLRYCGRLCISSLCEEDGAVVCQFSPR